MIEAYKEFWKRYVDFEGTSSRSKFWYVVLVNVLIGTAIGILSAVRVLHTAVEVIDSLWGLACFIPSVAIDVRRLKDAGKSWANIFWFLLPIVGWIILIVYFCQPSVKKEESAPQQTTEA